MSGSAGEISKEGSPVRGCPGRAVPHKEVRTPCGSSSPRVALGSALVPRKLSESLLNNRWLQWSSGRGPRPRAGPGEPERPTEGARGAFPGGLCPRGATTAQMAPACPRASVSLQSRPAYYRLSALAPCLLAGLGLDTLTFPCAPSPGSLAWGSPELASQRTDTRTSQRSRSHVAASYPPGCCPDAIGIALSVCSFRQCYRCGPGLSGPSPHPRIPVVVSVCCKAVSLKIWEPVKAGAPQV